MTMVVPSSPPGSRALQSNGDAGQGRRNAGDVDFAAALSETAGDANADSGGDEAKAAARDIAGPSPRGVHRLDARERRATAAVDKTDTDQNTDAPGGVVDRHFTGVRDAALPSAVDGHRSQAVPDATPAADKVGMDALAATPPAIPRSDPVRDALAVLGVDLAGKHEAVASSAEPVTQSRRPASAGGSAPVAKRTAVGSGETGSFDSPDLPGDVPDIAATSIKVMRQETHFQPVAHEARRLLGMTAGAPGERTLPLTLAAAAKIARPQALQRASEDPPAIAVRVTEAAGSNAPIALAADGSTLGGVGQQIADGIQRAMDEPADPAMPRSTPSLDPAAPPAFAPAIRSIKLQLNPHSLGVVTIMLTGNDGDLRIHLEAERAETIGKVEQERGTLSARLNGAGYAISELTVGRMGAADTQGRDGDPKDAAARQGGQSGGQPGDTGGSGAREGAAQFADQRAGRHSDERATRTNAAAASATKSGVINQAVAGVSYAGRFRPV